MADQRWAPARVKTLIGRLFHVSYTWGARGGCFPGPTAHEPPGQPTPASRATSSRRSPRYAQVAAVGGQPGLLRRDLGAAGGQELPDVALGSHTFQVKSGAATVGRRCWGARWSGTSLGRDWSRARGSCLRGRTPVVTGISRTWFVMRPGGSASTCSCLIGVFGDESGQQLGVGSAQCLGQRPVIRTRKREVKVRRHTARDDVHRAT